MAPVDSKGGLPKHAKDPRAHRLDHLTVVVGTANAYLTVLKSATWGGCRCYSENVNNLFGGGNMTSRMEEFEGRLSELKKLAGRLTADTRRLSTALEVKDSAAVSDPLVASAQLCKVPILTPLTIGTLLASVLGEIDSVESAIKGIERGLRPGERP